MKTIVVTLSDEQAARIEALSSMMNMTEGELLAIVSMSELRGWEDSPAEAVYAIEDDRRKFLNRGQAPGEDLEKFLRAGLVSRTWAKAYRMIRNYANNDAKWSQLTGDDATVHVWHNLATR